MAYLEEKNLHFWYNATIKGHYKLQTNQNKEVQNETYSISARISTRFAKHCRKQRLQRF